MSVAKQVILNLVVNARDAMPKGGHLTIETRMVLLEPGRREFTNLPRGPYVELRVSDTGAGIDPQHFDTIFEPFFTTKGVGQEKGLGLSVVDGVVKQLGGAISVDSKV